MRIAEILDTKLRVGYRPDDYTGGFIYLFAKSNRSQNNTKEQFEKDSNTDNNIQCSPEIRPCHGSSD
jgi:hypothetical protein